jgi:hypothetical protein
LHGPIFQPEGVEGFLYMKDSFLVSNKKIDACLLEGGMTAVAVYIGLCRIKSDLGDPSFFACNLNVVSRYSGVCKRSVNRYLPILKKAGAIDVISGVNKGGNCENTYKIIK